MTHSQGICWRNDFRFVGFQLKYKSKNICNSKNSQYKTAPRGSNLKSYIHVRLACPGLIYSADKYNLFNWINFKNGWIYIDDFDILNTRMTECRREEYVNKWRLILIMAKRICRIMYHYKICGKANLLRWQPRKSAGIENL